LSPGTYFIRIRTPAASQTHAFTVLLQTNVSDMRSASRPVSKPFPVQTIGSISANGRQYFRFDLSSNAAIRVALDSPNVSPDVYLNRTQIPSESVNLKRSVGVSNDVIALLETEALPGSYFVGVFSPGSAPANVAFILRIEPLIIPALAWDPGTTHEGTL